MSRRFVNEFVEQENIDQVFVASDKQLRPNRNGDLYLQVDLSDRTGTIGARMWNASESVFTSFENGDYVQVQGKTQLFQGAMQMICSRVSRVAADEINEEDFIPLAAVDVDRLVGRLTELLRGMDNPHLQSLAECFLMDDAFMAKFTRAPAGVKHHHAYLGGLLEHVVVVREVAHRVAPYYPMVDRDLLLMGAFLHDISKTDELNYQRDLAYSDEGQLIGHLVMAIGALDEKIGEAEKLSGEKIPDETILRLKHMIISHHGEYEFGSPKVPMTLEAVALFCIDNLDSKISAFDQMLCNDPNVGSTWTHYNPTLGRKLFKGAAGRRQR